MHVLAALTLLVSAADHWTTYVCLRAPVPDWYVAEANPIADWLFGSIGLVPGLLLDSGVTLGAVFFLVATHRIPDLVKRGVFGVLIAVTSIAVLSNFRAIQAMGLSPFGA